ncbi:MAG: gfo/Idh/MocA family oxidoreductase [Clostridiales bacterium]|nr:MAG: gfo/Idh/MocA family oxidoreductase [Clostridiales bacterium]
MTMLKVGILGAGGIASAMAKTISQMTSARNFAVASRDLNKAREFAAKWGVTKAYGSYEEMLADPGVDLVYVATPHSHHYPHVKLCLEHGKHVLCEKAFTVNAAQARELFRIAREKHLLLTEAMWTRFLPMRGTINEVLRSGIVGKPWLLTANLGYMISQVERLKEPSLAGGALLDVGVYPLNFAAMVFGNDPVSITGTAVLSDKGVDRQDSITLRYADGKIAVLNATMMGMSDRRGVIDCDNGMLEIVNINCPEELRVYNKDRLLIASYRAPKCISGYEYEVEACVRALDAGGIECPLMPHAETVRMMEWMDDLRAQFGVRYPDEIEKL